MKPELYIILLPTGGFSRSRWAWIQPCRLKGIVRDMATSPLSLQQRQKTTHLTGGVRVALLLRHCDAVPVDLFRLLLALQLVQELAQLEIAGHVPRRQPQQLAKA